MSEPTELESPYARAQDAASDAAAWLVRARRRAEGEALAAPTVGAMEWAKLVVALARCEAVVAEVMGIEP